jgi:type II restriction enzyme
VQTALPIEGLERYTSKSQRARVASEAWGLANLYCPNCDSSHLDDLPRNTPAIDYVCAICKSLFQLKSQSRTLTGCLTGASHAKFVQSINEDRTPNLLALHYKLLEWRVENLMLIPHFAFPPSAVEKRKPLNPTAERKGWIGYNIRLSAIPIDAKIPIVAGGKPRPAAEVRAQYERIRPLEKIKAEQRGWALEVLQVARSLGKTTFSLAEMYERDADLARLHPANRHIRDKIRQQLQVLRDKGLLEFLGGGTYRLA